MRICSLLPSIKETLFALGMGDSVVAVTHECDWPPEARTKTPVTCSRIRGEDCSSAEIDQQVREHDGSLYNLDTEMLARLAPDLILTQSLCPVCAVSEATVRATAKELANSPVVFSFQPTCLADVRAMIAQIGSLTGSTAAARRLCGRFEHEIEQIRSAVRNASHPPVVCLEWTNPPFACGHWTPELVEIAGGHEVLGSSGQPSRRATWQELLDADPQILLIAPCGFSLDRTLKEMPWLESQPGWGSIRAVVQGSVFATDGSAYFNRPGPRLIESLQILAEVIHPKRFGGLAPHGSFQQTVIGATPAA